MLVNTLGMREVNMNLPTPFLLAMYNTETQELVAKEPIHYVTMSNSYLRLTICPTQLHSRMAGVWVWMLRMPLKFFKG